MCVCVRVSVCVQVSRRLEPGRPWIRTVIHDFDVPGSYNRFRVSAINDEGESAISPPGPVGQHVASVPDSPSYLDCRVLGSTSGALCWLAPDDRGARILNYVVQYRKWVSVKARRYVLKIGRSTVSQCTSVHRACFCGLRALRAVGGLTRVVR